MIFSRRTGWIALLAAGLPALAGTARASEMGFDTRGSPLAGLLLLLGLVSIVTGFAFAYWLLIRAERRRVERMASAGNTAGLVAALRSPWLGPCAARALGEIGGGDAVEPLVAALRDPREDVRRAAAGALGRIGDERAVEPLSRTLDDSYASVRERARSAIDCIRQRARNHT